MRKTLLQLFMALSALALLLFFAFMSRTDTEEVKERRLLMKDQEVSVLKDTQTLPLPSENIYGFSIGKFYKAYRASEFLQINNVYDTIAGEGVILSVTDNDGVVMTHLETGEVFIPVKMTWSSWVLLHPDTLLYKNE